MNQKFMLCQKKKMIIFFEFLIHRYLRLLIEKLVKSITICTRCPTEKLRRR